MDERRRAADARRRLPARRHDRERIDALERGPQAVDAQHGLDRGRGRDDFDRRTLAGCWRRRSRPARNSFSPATTRSSPSIERGGMFETLRQKHGAAILSDVQRVKDAEQQAAFNQMHEGQLRRSAQDLRQGWAASTGRTGRATRSRPWPSDTPPTWPPTRQKALHVRLHQR